MAGEFQSQAGVSSVTLSRSATGKPSWDIKPYDKDIEKAANQAAFIYQKFTDYFGVDPDEKGKPPCRIKLPDDLKGDYPAIREITDAAAAKFPDYAHDPIIDGEAPGATTQGDDHPDNWGTSSPDPASGNMKAAAPPADDKGELGF